MRLDDARFLPAANISHPGSGGMIPGSSWRTQGRSIQVRSMGPLGWEHDPLIPNQVKGGVRFLDLMLRKQETVPLREQ